MILRDCQIAADLSALVVSTQREINHGLFASFEPIRLWLREQRHRAPFQKLLLEFVGPEHELSMPLTVEGMCWANDVVSAEELRLGSASNRWVLPRLSSALGRISQALHWRLPELETEIARLSSLDWPITYAFEKLARTPRRGFRIHPWLRLRPGESVVGATISGPGTNREVTLRSAVGPLFLEHEFPIARAVVENEQYFLIDRRGFPLASIDCRPG